MDDINLIGNEKGATVVETAIIIMLLFVFIFGIIEFGLLLFNKHLITNASREGARAGIVVGLDRSDPADPNYYVTEFKSEAFHFCTEHLVSFGSNIPYIDPPYFIDRDGNGIPSRGDDLTLHLNYDYDFLFLSAFGIGPVHLDADTIMKFE